MRLEERAWRRIGRLAPLREVMASRHGIRLAHGVAGPVDDVEVVVAKQLRPPRLSPVENLGRGEILEILVVRVNREGVGSTLQIRAPFLESDDDGEHLLVVDLVVQLGGRELARIERNGMENVVAVRLGENGCDGKVRSVGLHRRGAVRLEVSEDGRCGEGGLQLAESLAGRVVEDEAVALLEESRERRDDVGVALDEAAVEVGEAEENLEVVHRGRLWPIENGRDFLGIHLDAGGRDDVAEILDLVLMERALLWFGEEAVGAEAFQHEAYVALVFLAGPAEDEDVIEIDDSKVVQEVAQDVVHEVLEGGGSVGETKRHDVVLVVAIARTKRGLPLVTLRDANEVVAGTEVQLGVDCG